MGGRLCKGRTLIPTSSPPPPGQSGRSILPGSREYKSLKVETTREGVTDRTEQSLCDVSERSTTTPVSSTAGSSPSRTPWSSGPNHDDELPVEQLQGSSDTQTVRVAADNSSLQDLEKAHAPLVPGILLPGWRIGMGLATLSLVVLLFAACLRNQRMAAQSTTLRTTRPPTTAVHATAGRTTSPPLPTTTARPSTSLRTIRPLTPSPDSCQAVAAEAAKCSLSMGPIRVGGYRALHVLKAGANKPGWAVGEVEADNCGTISVHRQGRAYLAETCGNNYSSDYYSAIDFRGKTIRYSIDLRSAGCGCIAAFYLVSMRQNKVSGSCGGDFYCDANKTCGPSCTEIDLMEANFIMWKTTLHSVDDAVGLHSALSGFKYGPGSDCIDTGQPFQVAASVDSDGSQVLVTLAQRGCSTVALVERPEMGEAFRNGMTPVLSYWFDPTPGNSKWFDGAMCKQSRYNPEKDCGASVILSNFSIEDTSVMVSW